MSQAFGSESIIAITIPIKAITSNVKRIKKDSERKVKVSITISPDINKVLEEITSNKSKYIEYSLLEYFNKCGLDTSKIKIS